MTGAITETEADILDQVELDDETEFTPELARWLLKLRLRDDAQTRISELLDRNNQGVLTDPERAELERYLRVGRFLDLWKEKRESCWLSRRAPETPWTPHFADW
jgi:hypothetical protein